MASLEPATGRFGLTQRGAPGAASTQNAPSTIAASSMSDAQAVATVIRLDQSDLNKTSMAAPSPDAFMNARLTGWVSIRQRLSMLRRKVKRCGHAVQAEV